MKILYLEVDETVPGIVDRVRRLGPPARVALVVPPRANLLAGTINLRLLARALPEVKFRLVIADPRAQKIAENLGFEVREKLTISKKTSAPARRPAGAPPVERPAARPDFSPKKLSLADVVRAERGAKNSAGFSLRRMLGGGAKTRPAAPDPGIPPLVVMAPNRRVLGGFLAGAAALLLFVAYIALPSATVRILPAMHQISFATNVIFAPEAEASAPGNAAARRGDAPAANLVATRELETEISEKLTFPATGILPEGDRARGEVTLTNKDTKPKYFVPSRLQTESGLIFRFESPVTIPAATDDGPGTIRVPVVADELDASGRLIGDRGNIPAGEFFTFPAIPFLSPLFYAGENEKPFTGGKTREEKKLVEADLTAAEAGATAALRKKSLEKLTADAKDFPGDWAILDIPEAIEIEVLKMDLPPRRQIGEKMKNFEVAATVRVRARAFDRGRLAELLVLGLERKLHPDTFLAAADLSGVEFRFLSKDARTDGLKVDAELAGREVFDWREDSAVGQNLRAKLRRALLGATTDEARGWLSGRAEIADFEVSTWPMWRDRLPGVEGNLRISVDEI